MISSSLHMLEIATQVAAGLTGVHKESSFTGISNQ